MKKELDTLLEHLLSTTLSIDSVVADKDSDPDKWIELLAERDEIIQCVQGIDTSKLSMAQLQQISKMQEVNQHVLSKIEERQQKIRDLLSNLQRSKLATNSYQEIGPNGYGAFIDRKK